jgi:CheY-like chemotaxis protein
MDMQRLDGISVLVVDDNTDALEMLAEALRSSGAHVSTANSGSAAIEIWDRERADIVLCDLAMPEMDGFEVIAELRKREGDAGRRTPAIAVSAHASLEYRRRSLQAGFAEHVTKPYRVPELVQTVREALRA